MYLDIYLPNSAFVEYSIIALLAVVIVKVTGWIISHIPGIG